MTQMTAQQACELALQYHRAGKLAEAESIFRQVLAHDPARHDVCQHLAQIAYQTGRVDEGIELMRRAVGMAPSSADYRSNLAMLLSTVGRFDEAIPEYRQALALRPDLAEAHNNFGNVLRETGRAAEAEAAFRAALALRATSDARWNLAYMLLARGAFAEGWDAYEARLQVKSFPVRHFAQPAWEGGALGGRKILLHAEQGMGDTFQFIRYAPMVKARGGGDVTVLCQPETYRLLAGQRNLGVDRWVADGQPLPAFDVQCPLLSLPRLFGTTFESMPAEVPYLWAEAARVAEWRERIAASGGASEGGAGLAVGLVWGGNAFPIHNRKRSATLGALAPLAAAARGATFYSLQKGEAAAQAKSPPAGMTLVDWSDSLNDFADTAALISALDLVITIDTGVAHLAGALGKRTWVLLPFVADWRWFNGRSDSPWYPTMRLFRQPSMGDWATPVAEAARELSKLSEAGDGGEGTITPR